MAKAKHVRGWGAGSREELPARATILLTLDTLLLHGGLYCMRACENPPAFLSANCLQLSKWRGGKSSGQSDVGKCDQNVLGQNVPEKMFQKRGAKKSCLLFLGSSTLRWVAWNSEGRGIWFSVMIGPQPYSLGLSITYPASPELLQT